MPYGYWFPGVEHRLGAARGELLDDDAFVVDANGFGFEPGDPQHESMHRKHGFFDGDAGDAGPAKGVGEEAEPGRESAVHEHAARVGDNGSGSGEVASEGVAQLDAATRIGIRHGIAGRIGDDTPE